MRDTLGKLLEAMPEKKRGDKPKDITLLADLFDGIMHEVPACSSCYSQPDYGKRLGTPTQRIKYNLMENWTLPEVPKERDVLYVPYEVGRKKKHTIRAFKLQISDTDSMLKIRKNLSTIFKIDPKSYVMAIVSDNKVVKLLAQLEKW